VFKRDIATRIVSGAKGVTLYCSSKDEALKASHKVHGYGRAGDSDPTPVITPGIDSIDVSAVDTSFIGHSYYGESTSVIGDIFYLIRGVPLPRYGVKEAHCPAGRYWVFNPRRDVQSLVYIGIGGVVAVVLMVIMRRKRVR
jgi:hypothetical protein